MQRTLFHNLNLFDGISDALTENKIIVVVGERIEAIEDAESMRSISNYQKIDLIGKPLLPGFIDARIHYRSSFYHESDASGASPDEPSTCEKFQKLRQIWCHDHSRCGIFSEKDFKMAGPH